MIDTNYANSGYGAFYINEFHKKSAQEDYEKYKEKPQRSEDFSYEAKKFFTNLGVDVKMIDIKPQDFFYKIAQNLSRISKLYFNKAPEVKLVENSIFQRQWEGTLSEAEKEAFNELEKNKMLIPVSESSKLKNIDLDKEKEILLKTTSNITDFVKKYSEIRNNYEKQALKEYEEMFSNLKQSNEEDKSSEQISTQNTINSTQTQEEKAKPFKPIQAKSSNKETYKADNTRAELLKKLLENKFDKSKELELLFGMKLSNDNTDDFKQILAQKIMPKSIDIKV